MARTDTSNRFVLEVFDCELWCAIAQAPFHLTDVGPLRSILGLEAVDDAELTHIYYLDDDQVAAIVSAFGTFDPRQLDDEAEIEILLFRLPGTVEMPYLAHTNWELPLLLDGRKKLARFSDLYPSPLFDCEEAFDRWVANGVLHKEVVDEPFEKPIKNWLGHRAVYYTPKGEEWRIPAHKLIEDASDKSGGWNEHFERLEGMLFGYEDWQNDWWIKNRLEHGAFGGATFCCAVTAAGLAWAESAGLRALPPVDPTLPVIGYRRETSAADLEELLQTHPDRAAVLRFTVGGFYRLQHIIDSRQSGLRQVPGQQVAELNKHLVGAVVVIMDRRNPKDAGSAA
jgi:hypothetical protein